MSRGFSKDFMLEVAKGNIAGHYAINKFGSSTNIDTTPTDVWDHVSQNTWLAPTAARIHEIVSTSDADSDSGGTVAQGAGARTIRIWGLQDWDTAETTEDIIMDGTATGANSVDTANAYVIIHRMRVLTTGSVGPFANVGIISANAKVDGTTTAQIFTAKGQTQMAIMGVPSTQQFFMDNFKCSIAQSSPGATRVAGVILFSTTDVENNPTVFTFKHTAAIMATGTTSLTVPFSPPKDGFQGPCIIKIAMVAGTNDSFCDASFDGVLVDN